MWRCRLLVHLKTSKDAGGHVAIAERFMSLSFPPFLDLVIYLADSENRVKEVGWDVETETFICILPPDYPEDDHTFQHVCDYWAELGFVIELFDFKS